MTSPALALERSVYIGNIIGGILLGLQIYITFQAIYYLTASQSRASRARAFYIAYEIVLLVCSIIGWAVDCLLGQYMFIENPGYPGGPAAWFSDNSAVWWNIFGSAFDMLAIFMADGLLLYRCYIVWGSNRWIIAFPALLYLVSTVTAVIAVVESALPGSSFFVKSSTNWGIPWISLTTAFNVMVTTLITTRILRARNLARTVMPHEMAETYTNIVAILIESSLPFTIIGVAFTVTLGKGLPSEAALAVIYGFFPGLAPQMIILRVAMGRAWTKETIAQFTSIPSMTFAPPPVPTANGSQVASTLAVTSMPTEELKSVKSENTLSSSV
ncbi:hypothetical protein OE88DRAFT_1808561 [Heliocybe sulcata]|uniref:Uncharacterized protein n=1 Tax=Heliocybe sulcata TaxID=5364 RepID=A0A5C3N187_9AGAM|nr:hypothetical protein OE88DRAFT_1808561 [Heliocybe sulcata]